MRAWTLLLVGCAGSGAKDEGGDTALAVDADGDGFTVGEGDCDDSSPSIHPAASDLAGDGYDQNCDGADGIDGDGDGVASVVSGGTDCDDANPEVSAPMDGDLDGQTGCDGDCDDADPARFSANPEVCNGIDDDCANDVDHDSAGLDVCAREEVLRTSTGLLDLLVVVDDSGSMTTEQQKLAEAASVIIEPLMALGPDVAHVGVVTTDMVRLARSGRLVTSNGFNYIDASIPAPEQVFREMVTVGTMGSGTEKGFDAAYTALTEYQADANAGFARPDADLAIVVVSDEPDMSTIMDNASFEAWLTTFRSAPAVTTFHAVVDEGWGQEYVSLVAAVGGTWMSSNNDVWEPGLAAMTTQIIPGATTVLALAEEPDPATLAVEVTEPSGTVVNPALVVDYDYDPVAIALVFHGDGYVPPADSEVVVSYRAISD